MIKIKHVFFQLTILLTLVMVVFSIQVNGMPTQPKIMMIDSEQYPLSPWFRTIVSAYGEITIKHSPDVFTTSTIDYLRQFDLFVTESNEGWKDYPNAISVIGTLVDEGKSLLVLDGFGYDPADAWVSHKWYDMYPYYHEFALEIVPSNLTNGVRTLTYYGSANYVLYGGYPLVRTPLYGGGNLPDPPAACAVYGYYGTGKFVVIGSMFESIEGDVGVLFSNIMYWLTNREAPPPPSVVELDWKIAQINNTINFLYSKLLILNKSINQLYERIPQLGEFSSQLNQTQQQIDTLIDRLDNLSDEIANLKSQQNILTYVVILAIPISVASLIIALRRRLTPAR